MTLRFCDFGAQKCPDEMLTDLMNGGAGDCADGGGGDDDDDDGNAFVSY